MFFALGVLLDLSWDRTHLAYALSTDVSWDRTHPAGGVSRPPEIHFFLVPGPVVAGMRKAAN